MHVAFCFVCSSTIPRRGGVELCTMKNTRFRGISEHLGYILYAFYSFTTIQYVYMYYKVTIKIINYK